MVRLLFVLSLCILATGCFNDSSEDSLKSNESSEASHDLNAKPVIHLEEEERVTLAQNLEIPWSIAKSDDTFYVTERGGNLLRIESDGEVVEQEIMLSKDVLHFGESGLLGFLLAPDFAQSGQAYAYYTYQEGEHIYNRVVLLENEGHRWEEVDVLIDQIPGEEFHDGGRLEIGPDGKIYVTTGDAVVRELAQNVNSLAGKILRMNLDGSIPEDNPFENSYVYSYGHRNPQGITWDNNGVMYSTEHGSSAHDEINLIEPGQNYGWPAIQGDAQQEGMVTPIYHTGETTWAPSGIDIYKGKIYIAALRGSQIIAYDIAEGTTETFYQDSGRMRDVWIEDGYLYTITSNRDGRGNPEEADDQLLRLKLPD
ncbi:PQQ-dependent sugar dehydrogenase [Tenuibacillus multivorans]|nr:PQQ-dependent sugar dehydrogenase [Tenuibacillus multivorans]GEL76413.1 dehydrogenase [Tenuibacillus multivorans]